VRAWEEEPGSKEEAPSLTTTLTKMGKRVLALFDVDGTLTAPRKVRI
jgi:hypothetical protein